MDRKIYKYLFTYLLLLIIFGGAGIVLCEDEFTDLTANVKCGTFWQESVKKQILQSLCKVPDSTGRTELQAKIPSSSGKFLIHYDTTGINAVPLEDTNGNGIPDYVDSVSYYFDYAYLVEVDSMGYCKPASDNGRGGSDAVDVYLLNIGDYKYSPKPAYGITYPDFQIYLTRTFPCYASFTVIDNDFSPLDSLIDNSGKKKPTFNETGIKGMKITACHEFHHVLQNNYGISFPQSSSLNELTSTGMEFRLFPDTKDYYSQIKGFFRSPSSYPLGIGDPESGYKNAAFTQYINRNFGDIILRRMWEMVSDGFTAYRAFDSSFKESGTSLATEWCNYAPWIYFTGTRAKHGEYFAYAEEFPMINFSDTLEYTSPSIMYSGFMKSFEVRVCKHILPKGENSTADTLDLILMNTDLNAAIMQIPSDKSYNVTIAKSALPGFSQIENTQYYYLFQSNNNLICDTQFFNSGHQTQEIDFVYPNPYRQSDESYIYFPVPEGALLQEKVTLTVSNAEMVIIYSADLSIESDNRNRVVVWRNIPSDLSKGVYIFSVRYKDSEKIGKFAVVE